MIKSKYDFRLFLLNIIVGSFVLFANLYIRSITYIDVTINDGTKELAVVKKYFEYFNILTVASIIIICTVIAFNLIIIIRERNNAIQRLNKLSSLFDSAQLDHIMTNDNQLESEDYVIINAWNKSVSEIKSQIETREEYLKTMIHDFKSPIQILKSNISLYRLDHEDNSYINFMHEELVNLERDVLNYLTIEKINYFEKPKITNCDISEYLRLLQMRYRHLDVTFTVNISEDSRVIFLDRSMFNKMVENIVENAIKHGIDKHVVITVTKDIIRFENKVAKGSKDIDIFKNNKRVKSKNGNGLGAGIIKTYANLLHWHVSSCIKDDTFIVSILLSSNK